MADPVETGRRDGALMALHASGLLLGAAGVLQIVLQLAAGSQWSGAVGRPTFVASLVLLSGAAVTLSLRRIGGVSSSVADAVGVAALRVFAGLIVVDILVSFYAPWAPLSEPGGRLAYSIAVLSIDVLILIAAALAIARTHVARRVPRRATLIAGGAIAWYAAAGLFWLAVPVVLPNASQGLLITVHVVSSVAGPSLIVLTGVVWVAVARSVPRTGAAA